MKNEVHKFIEVDTDLSTGLEEISDDEDILPRLRTDEEDVDGYPEYADELIFKDKRLDINRYKHTGFDDF